jgi:surfeit locus 1 family protein
VELTRSGILATAIVLVVVVVCVRLGFWQLDRREQRMERNAAIAERLAAPTVVMETPPEDSTGLSHRTATARGAFDHDRSIVLGGRSFRGAPGVYVLTPLLLGDGAILVNRGWVPAPDAATVDLTAIQRAPESVVTGVLMAFPDVQLPPADQAFRTRWFRLDGEAIRAQYPYPVAPLYLQATGEPEAAPAPGHAGADLSGGGFAPVPIDPPSVDSGPHLSYAVQWFSFAAIFLIGWTVLALRRTRTSPTRG